MKGRACDLGAILHKVVSLHDLPLHFLIVAFSKLVRSRKPTITPLKKRAIAADSVYLQGQSGKNQAIHYFTNRLLVLTEPGALHGLLVTC